MKHMKNKLAIALASFIFAAMPAKAFVSPLPLMINSNYVIVGPSNAPTFFASNVTSMINALNNAGFTSGGVATVTNAVATLNGLSSNVTLSVTMVGSNAFGFYDTLVGQTITHVFVWNTNALTLPQMQAMGLAISNEFATITSQGLMGTTISNNFATIASQTLMGTTISNNFATITSQTLMGITLTNLIGAWTNLNQILNLGTTNAPFLKATFYVRDGLGVATNGSTGFHFNVDTGGNLLSDGTAGFTGNVTAPNFFLTGGRGTILPAQDGITTNLSTKPGVSGFSQRWYATNGALKAYVDNNGNFIMVAGLTNSGPVVFDSDFTAYGDSIFAGAATFLNSVNMSGVSGGNSGILIIGADGQLDTTFYTPVDATAYGVTYAITNATDVALTSVANGQALIWDATNHRWKNGTVANGGGGGSSTNAMTLITTNAAALNVGRTNGAQWRFLNATWYINVDTGSTPALEGVVLWITNGTAVTSNAFIGSLESGDEGLNFWVPIAAVIPPSAKYRFTEFNDTGGALQTYQEVDNGGGSVTNAVTTLQTNGVNSGTDQTVLNFTNDFTAVTSGSTTTIGAGTNLAKLSAAQTWSGVQALTNKGNILFGNGAGITNVLKPIGFVSGDGSSTVATNWHGYYYVTADCVITNATVLAHGTGSVTLDFWKCTYSQFDDGSTHPVIGDSITAAAPLQISSGTKATTGTLTGWTTNWSRGDIIECSILSVTNVTWLNATFEGRSK